MKSKCFSVKSTARRSFLRMLATLLSILLLITSLGLGSIISVSAWQWTGGYTIYNNLNGWTPGINCDAYTIDSSANKYQYYHDYFLKKQDYSVEYYFKENSGTKYDIRPKSNDTYTWSQANNTVTYDGAATSGGNWKFNANTLLPNSGYYYRIRCWWQPYYNNGDGQMGVTVSQLSNITTAYTVTSASIVAGEAKDVTPDNVSGGSESYSYSYTVTKGGADVTASCMTGNIFRAFEAGTYVVNATATDTNCTLCGALSDATDTPLTITVTADWHITGLLDFGANSISTANKMTDNGNGTYSIDVYLEEFASGHGTEGEHNSKFTLKSGDGTLLGPTSSGDYVFRASNWDDAVTMNPNDSTHYFCFGFTSGETNPEAGFYTITWNPSTMKLQLSSNSVGMVKVWAKDGAAATDSASDKYSYAHIADTTITAVSGTPATKAGVDVGKIGTDTSSGYVTSYVTKGHTVTVKTTIDASNKERYYVKAFNVNGVSKNVIEASAADTTNGIYTFTYTIPETFADSYIEITPIFYILPTALPSGNSTVTFYLEGFSSDLGWGDTPYAYPFYGSLGGIDNSFGAYPGQPFLYTDGRYSIEIPVKNINLSSFSGSTNATGVTVNNGKSDYVHQLAAGITTEYQTYDSDGFFKAYNELRDSNSQPPNALYFAIKNVDSSTGVNHRNTYGGDAATTWYYDENVPVTSYDYSDAATLISTIGETDNGWELYTDHYGRPIDLFGTVIGNSYVAANEADNAAVRVISSGYIPNIAGDYGSGWLVYYPNGTATTLNSGSYVSSNGYTLECDTSRSKARYAIPSSVFMIQDSNNFNTSVYPAVDHTSESYRNQDDITNYQTMWTNLRGGAHDVRGKYVYISYEKNAQIHANTGSYRADSRWYYTFATDMVSANIKIQYGSGASWTDASGYTSGYNGVVNQDTDHGSRAYFTNSEFDGEMTSGDLLINGTTLAFTAQAGSGYMFSGWYRLDSSGNAVLIDTNGSLSGTMLNSSNETLIARFTVIADGNLNITHKASVDGIADTKMQVKVYDAAGGTQLYDSGLTSSGVLLDSNYISNTHESYYITVTLQTTMLGLNTFTNFGYDAFNTAKSITATESTGSSPKTSTFAFTVGQLYDPSDATKQDYNSLTYTSNVSQYNTTGSYNYKYKDRSGNWRTYSATIYITSEESTAGHPDCDGEVTVYTKNSSNTYTGIAEALASRAPSSSLVNVYQKTLNFSFVSGAWDQATFGNVPSGETAIGANATWSSGAINVYAYETVSSYTLTYICDGASNSVSESYGTPIIFTGDALDAIPATSGGNRFIGWSTVSGDATKIISPYRSFGLILTQNMTVYAVYGTADTAWKAYIDMITANRENTNAYLDILCRFTSNDGAEIPDGATCGVMVVSGAGDLSTYMNDTYIEKYAASMEGQITGENDYKQAWANKNARILATNYVLDKANIGNFGRVDLILSASYSSVTETNVAIYSYITIDGTTYRSTPVYGTFTGGAN